MSVSLVQGTLRNWTPSVLPADIGCENRVPMGGDLAKTPEGADTPTVFVAAINDPFSGSLDRMQIIKG